MHTLECGGREIQIFSGKTNIFRYFIERFISISVSAIREKGFCAVALSGGNTPALLYEAIAHENTIDWSAIHIFLADERLVPIESPMSNYKMIDEHLIQPGKIPPSHVHPVDITESAELSAKEYETEILDYFQLKKGGIPAFDIILLGLGNDGHTASLFPGESLQHDDAQHIVTSASGGGMERVTLTLGVLNNASHVFFLVTGKEKAAVVSKVIDNNDMTLPAARVRPLGGEPVFMLDEDAASLLGAFHRG